MLELRVIEVGMSAKAAVQDQFNASAGLARIAFWGFYDRICFRLPLRVVRR